MIEIVHGFERNKKGYNAAIYTSHKNSAGIVETIMANSARYDTLNTFGYYVEFVNPYYVFSKFRIVTDDVGDGRIGFIAFSIALQLVDFNNGINIFEKLSNLQYEYYYDKDKLFSQSNRYDISTPSKEPEESNTQKKIVHLYYNDKNELLNYLCYNKQYKKYKRVFFIAESYREQDNNPLNSIRHDDQEITFENLRNFGRPEKPNSEKLTIDVMEEPVEEISIKKRIVDFVRSTDPFITLLVGLLLGIAVGLWSYRFFVPDKLDAADARIENVKRMNTIIVDQNTKIKELEDKVKTLQDSINTIFPGADILSGNSIDKETGEKQSTELQIEPQLKTEINDFLSSTQLKDMTLSEIETKIKEYQKRIGTTDRLINRRLEINAAILTVIKDDPINIKKLSQCCITYKESFNLGHELGKFYKHLKGIALYDNCKIRPDNRLNRVALKINDKTTLREIELHYGYR